MENITDEAKKQMWADENICQYCLTTRLNKGLRPAEAIEHHSTRKSVGFMCDECYKERFCSKKED